MPGVRITDSAEIAAADAQASSFMKEGIRLMQTEDGVEPALVCFERALELRRRLPPDIAAHAYGLAACWLNRAEALTRLGADYTALTLAAYDEALALLSTLPLSEASRYSQRLAIAHQNRALVLVEQNPPEVNEALLALTNAITVLDDAKAMDAPEREYLQATVWTNRANILASEYSLRSDSGTRAAARRALALIEPYERVDAAAVETGLNARHVLCRLVARRLESGSEAVHHENDVHEATDLADEALGLVRTWEQRGVDRFRKLAADFLRFGALTYSRYQPHFLEEFVGEQLDPRRSSPAYVFSGEMQAASSELAQLLRLSGCHALTQDGVLG